MKRSQTIGLIILSATLMASYLELGLFIHANASPQARQLPQKKVVRFIPSGVGAPTNRSAAATRGQCESSRPVATQNGQAIQLIALVPDNELGLTTAESPAIAFYIPPTCAETMHLSLLDTMTQKSYDALLTTPTSSGIINLKLSSLKDFPGLEIGKKYQWELRLVLDARDPSADASVNGWLQRRKTEANPSFWFDRVTALIEARQAKPQDTELKEEWTSLMGFVGLDTIANQSLIANFVAKPAARKYTDLMP
jgi:hypothetical protein